MNAKNHREAIEMTYTDICNVKEYKPTKDERSKLIKEKPVMVYENIPCRLSYSSSPLVEVNNGVSEKKQEIKLFIAPEIKIKPNSILIVYQNKKETGLEYKRSSETKVYDTHQEITVELREYT
ncbi:hypothetical protein [Anaerofustis stercorihominis]|uniref:hypothetical protein n=1 Tax=Anaerofustis stercorihominis TaxID=214853 RepID=UPI003991A1C6